MKKLKYIFVLLFISNLGFAQSNNIFDIARKGSVLDIKNEIEKDTNIINAVNDKGYSMLILACYNGNKEVASFLIDKNANLNYKSNIGTAIMACVVKGDSDLLTKLLKKGADPNLSDENGVTALMYAIQMNNEQITKILLNSNADKSLKSKEGKTAFEYAIFSKNEKLINLLK